MPMTRLTKVLIVFLFAVGLFPRVLFAHDIPGAVKEYVYDNIHVTIQVNKDSTFDVAERQTYDFNGHFHKGWRSIILKDIGSITDVVVKDEAGVPLTYSAQKLDKQDPANWGKYTYYRENGAENIEWYYSATSEKKAWTVFYKVHGGISFLKDHDEIYWNLFTDYDMPVGFAEATVMLPEGVSDMSLMRSALYSSRALELHTTHESTVLDARTFHFALAVASPKEDVTIAAGWPKGVVDQGAYWRDFFVTHIFAFLSVLVVLLSLLFGFIRWYLTEVRGQGRGTIIPEYAPPKDLPPAMAEALVKEGITTKAWPATIVDLAVRGYIDITEEDASFLSRFGRFVAVAIPLVLAIFFLGLSHQLGSFAPLFTLMVFAVLIFRLAFSGGNLRNFFSPKEYVLTKKREHKNDPSLKKYEQTFLYSLLGTNGQFSTKEMKKSVARKQALFMMMKQLKAYVYEELEQSTGAYEVGISKEANKVWAFILVVVAIFVYVKFLGNGLVFNEGGLLIIVTGLCVAILFAFIKYEARLSKEGAILREEWLGFKLYLETAERDRLQNLTPELFEKYLPYAIIFGVEKKWAKAFDLLNLPPPNWYHASMVGMAHSSSTGTGSGGFTPSAFSASFASSLSSAFSSAGGGGGASGGGGGAGGGGGGGGGGAS